MTKRRLPRWSELKPLLRTEGFDASATNRRLRRAASISDLREIARRRTPRAVFDYTDGAAGDEVSAARSRRAFERVEFVPRVLRDVSVVDTSTRMLGKPVPIPLALGPTGFTRMMHHAGEPAVARAAGRFGLPYTLSTMGTTSLERLAAQAPSTRRWFQLYLWRDRDASADFVKRAIDCGYDTLMLTVDTPIGGARLRDARNGMTIPPALRLRTFVDGARHPHWWFNFLTTEPLEFASLKHFAGTPAELSNKIFDPSATIDDVRWLREAWPGKLVVKGVQTVEDAEACVAAGADALVVSNHGARQLDRSPTPLELLPGIAARCGERAEIYLDGGVRSGGDIAAAVALGARGVLIGRAYLYGLMAGGERGVDHALRLLTTEFTATMRLLGVTSVAELTGERVRMRGCPCCS
ncbi:alpha-hydroxy acid oxidase [Gandjariella thermophila]|uniref:Alpha-hydroxy-acid oxidizing enzyme n=1 Tax=Gandjariella thermophila TaxID=1931992 RepID=A0A4D4JDT4_9PSEU|nr:alpha-hydroxy acid oxidase [Gandjariella thermophila]GDY32519.1 alpha-hydroxy-acid oxidizing enzyme [Gandjariella thermophila]